MELQHIRYFVMCAKYLSFSRVAELSYTSQPSVSKAISALEAEVGGPLFVRSSRNMSLTHLGEDLLPYAEALLEKEDALRGFLHQYHSGTATKPMIVGISKMLIGAPYDALLFPLTNAVEGFKTLHKDTDIKIRSFEEPELRDLLNSEKIDVAVLVVNSGHISEEFGPKDDFLRLNEVSNYLLYSPEVKDVSTIYELLPHLDCIFSVTDQVAISSSYDFLRHVKYPLPVKPCDSWSEVIIRVKNGQGATILSEQTAHIAMECGLKCFPLDEMGITSSLFAAWKHEKGKLPEDFANVLRSWFCNVPTVMQKNQNERRQLLEITE